MASVDLSTLWVNDAADPSVAYALPLTGVKWKTHKEGEVRSYGNGRRRLVRRTGTPRGAAFTLGFCERATVDLLEGWVGRLLCFRDPMGRKAYGVFWDVEVDELDAYGEDGGLVTLDVEEVTHSEEV